MKQKVTLRQIAELAGISANSVSKALKDSPSISKEMKEKVREIANQLGYFPNSHAQSLRSGSSHVIAVVYDNITNPYYQIMSEEIYHVLSSRGYEMMIFIDCNANGGYLSDIVARRILSYGVDGILTFVAPTASATKLITQNHMPIVLVGRDGSATNTESIYSHDAMGGKLAAQELIRLNGTSFAYVTKHGALKINELRLQGFKNELHKHGITLKKDHIITGDLEVTIDTLIKNLLKKEKVDSIFCFSDIIAYDTISILYNLGYKVPEDINVIGYDNLQEYFPYPLRLTSINVPKNKMIQNAFDMLLSQTEEHRFKRMDVELVIGTSTKPR